MNASHQKVLRPKALVAALLAVPALSACGVNFSAQTDQIYIPADGVNNREGSVDVLNALIVSDEPGTGRLVAGLSNGLDEDDTLVDVRGAGDDEAVTVDMQEIDIPANQLVQLADSDLDEAVIVSGDGEAMRAGGFIRLSFTFEGSDAVELNVPVLEPGSDYEDVELPTSTTEEPADDTGDEPTDEPTDTPTDSETAEG